MEENCFNLTQIIDSDVDELNYLIRHRNVILVWNGFSNVPVVPLCVSYNKTARTEYFVKNGEMVTVEEHWLSKYQHELQYPDAPLVVTALGEYLPVEAVWFRICLTGYQEALNSLSLEGLSFH